MNIQFNVFPKERKSDKSPIYSGNGKIGDKEIDIAIWKKLTKSGVEYYSVSVKDKVAKQDNSSDLPFGN